MEESIDIPISVSYDKGTRIGKLKNLDLAILVDDADHSKAAARVAMSIKHKNYLKCHFGVAEKKNKMGKTTHPAVMVHQHPGDHLKQYLSQTAGPSIVTYTVPANDAAGNPVTDPYTFGFVPNFYRMLFRTIISFINYLHLRKKSIDIDGFNLQDDIFIDVTDKNNKEIEFFNLKFVDSNTASEAKDFENVAKLIEEIVQLKNTSNLEMPADLIHLLNEMRDSRWNTGSLVAHHLATLSTNDRIGHIHNFAGREKFIKVNQGRAYNAAIRHMVRSSDNLPDWTARFDGTDPKVGPVADCFAFNSEENGQRYVGVVSHGVDEYWVNRSLLWFCRNQVEHLSQHLPTYKKNFSTHDVDILLMSFFGEELMSFQKQANDEDILEFFL